MSVDDARAEALAYYGQPSTRFGHAKRLEGARRLEVLTAAFIEELPPIYAPQKAREMASRAIREIEQAWNNLDGVA